MKNFTDPKRLSGSDGYKKMYSITVMSQVCVCVNHSEVWTECVLCHTEVKKPCVHVMFNSVKMWILLTHTLLGKHSMLGDAHTGQRVSLVSHMLCFTCVSVCLWERRRNICFYSLVEAFIKIYLPNITVSAVCVRLKVCKWLLVNACIPIWLDKDVVAFSSLLFQLEVGLFFSRGF